MSRKDNTKKKKTAGDYILTLVLIAAICVFCYAAFNLYHIYTEYKKVLMSITASQKWQ